MRAMYRCIATFGSRSNVLLHQLKRTGRRTGSARRREWHTKRPVARFVGRLISVSSTWGGRDAR